MRAHAVKHMPIQDRWELYALDLDGPYTRAVAVTPNDDVDLPFRTLALQATETAGVVNVHMAGSTTPVSLYLAQGEPLRVRVDRVLATGTTATGIRALD